MGCFLLVHGAFQGSWIWDRLTPHLEHLGHRVRTVDLPGARDGTTLDTVTIDVWSRAIKAAALDCGERPFVVAHDVSGAALAHAAELRPEAFARLVYLAAFLPTSMGTALDVLGRAPGPSHLRCSLSGAGAVSLDADWAVDAFFHDCPSDDARAMADRFVPEAVLPVVTEVTVSRGRFGSVPRAYVECTLDRVVPIELQRLMCSDVPCDPVITIATGHAPFLAAPDLLAKELDRLA